MAFGRAQPTYSDSRRSSVSRCATVRFQIIRAFPANSHWLILAALILYFTSSAAPTKWRLAAGAALCFLAATIHAYIIVMVLLIDTGAHLRAAMSSKEVAGASLGARLYWIGLRVGISLASAIAGLIIFGLLRPLELRAYAEGGYGAFSINLLAPIDPGNFGALVLKPQPQVGILQYEGYNYLGLGVILLGTLALAPALRPSLFVRNLCRREAAATWLICAVSLFLALSLKATVGSWTIYDISVPSPVFEALSAFRASGRFFWPAYYLLLCGVITLAFAAFGRRWAALALSCALLFRWRIPAVSTTSSKRDGIPPPRIRLPMGPTGRRLDAATLI